MSNNLTPEQREIIISALKSKDAIVTCPRCRANNGFTLLDGFTYIPIQPLPKGAYQIGGPAFPAIILACNNCGYLSFHLAIKLGLLQDKDGKNE